MASKTQPEARRTERLEARVTPAEKQLLTRAAELSGRSLTDFLLANLHESARRILRQHNVMSLSDVDSSAFLDVILHPPEPNPAVRRAARRYREMRGIPEDD
jgi:uncharacterized protein (DUF1778 family)